MTNHTRISARPALAAAARHLHDRLPPGLGGRIAHLKDVWTGREPGFNWQRARQECVRQILAAIQPQQIVETGTFHGATTRWFAQHVDVQVFSVEANPEAYAFARARLRYLWQPVLVLDDSVVFLRRRAELPEQPAPVLYYLDAHWYEHLPLLDELTIILEHMPKAVIMIDDFQVPDDPGYGYDDYGPDRALTLDYLRPLTHHGLHLFFPATPSGEETGSRRGSVVLTSWDELAAKLERVALLRRRVLHIPIDRDTR